MAGGAAGEGRAERGGLGVTTVKSFFTYLLTYTQLGVR